MLWVQELVLKQKLFHECGVCDVDMKKKKKGQAQSGAAEAVAPVSTEVSFGARAKDNGRLRCLNTYLRINKLINEYE